MVKTTEIMIFVFGIIAVALLIGSAIIVHSSSESDMKEIRQYQAKKEDLLSSQDRLQAAIIELNTTLQMKAVEQDSLVKQINSLSKDLSDVTNLTSNLVVPQVTAPAPVATPVKTTTPTPTPRRTRAS